MSVDLELPDYIVDLYNLEVLLLPIKEHVVCLSIHFFPIYSMGLINLKFLLSIELLRLHCCGVQKSFSKCNKLRELKYTPDYVLNYSSTMERLNHVDLLGLSLPLKALDLWWYDGVDDVTEPNNTLKSPSLELVPITCNGSELPSARRDILQLMTCRETTSIAFWEREMGEGHTCIIESFLEEFYQIERQKGFKLEALELDAFFYSKLRVLSSKQLVHWYMGEEYWRHLQLPTTLKELLLAMNDIESSKELLLDFPIGFVKLDLT